MKKLNLIKVGVTAACKISLWKTEAAETDV